MNLKSTHGHQGELASSFAELVRASHYPPFSHLYLIFTDARHVATWEECGLSPAVQKVSIPNIRIVLRFWPTGLTRIPLFPSGWSPWGIEPSLGKALHRKSRLGQPGQHRNCPRILVQRPPSWLVIRLLHVFRVVEKHVELSDMWQSVCHFWQLYEHTP